MGDNLHCLRLVVLQLGGLSTQNMTAVGSYCTDMIFGSGACSKCRVEYSCISPKDD